MRPEKVQDKAGKALIRKGYKKVQKFRFFRRTARDFTFYQPHHMCRCTLKALACMPDRVSI